MYVHEKLQALDTKVIVVQEDGAYVGISASHVEAFAMPHFFAVTLVLDVTLCAPGRDALTWVLSDLHHWGTSLSRCIQGGRSPFAGVLVPPGEVRVCGVLEAVAEAVPVYLRRGWQPLPQSTTDVHSELVLLAKPIKCFQCRGTHEYASQTEFVDEVPPVWVHEMK